MNKAENNDQFDLETLRKQVSDVNRRSESSDGKSTGEPLNGYARQIAEQFSDGTRTPSIMIGQFRLLEFVAQFAIGLLGFLIWICLLYTSDAADE